MTNNFDISVIVTAHDETLVSGPTMRAAECAIQHARARGWRIDPMIALDRPTPQTSDWFSQDRFQNWRLHRFDAGDLGQVRNQSIYLAHGHYIAFLDADDLFSENWLSLSAAQLHKAEAQGRREIIHPELNWVFDGTQSVMAIPAQNDPLFVPEHMYFMNYYDSLCMTPRRAHLEHPYVTRDIPAGYSYQDWQFAVETMGAGWVHTVARDTVIFKRRRDRSLVTESHVNRAVVRPVPELDIDRIKKLKKAQYVLPSPSTYDPARPPYFGERFQKRIQIAQSRRAPSRDEERCHMIEENFDTAFYLAQNPDIHADYNMDVIAHYLRAGAREGRNPSPLFSTHLYRKRHPEITEAGENPFHHWVRIGRSEGRIGAPFENFEMLAKSMGLSPQNLEMLWQQKFQNLRQRLLYGSLGEQIAKACKIEPLISLAWPEALSAHLAPFQPGPAVPRTAALCHLQTQAHHKQAHAVICVNRPRWGGARRMEGHLAHSLASLYGAENVLVLTTDMSGKMPPGRLPKGVRHVDLAHVSEPLICNPRERLLLEFLRSLRPEYVFNVNSRLLWEAMIPYGSVLGRETRLVGCFLCNEESDYGGWTGYPLRQVYRHIDHHYALCTDSEALRGDLIDRYCMPKSEQAKIHVLKAPVDPSIPMVSPPGPLQKPTIFWAGRFDAQKRVDLLLGIAAALPDINFRVWGEAVLSTMPFPDFPENICHEGTYTSFHDLPLTEASAWLYTSAWDGVPQILLEVGMTGIPIVSTDVGGTCEALGTNATTLPATATAADYVKAIRAVLKSPLKARAQAVALREHLIEQRTPAHYAQMVAEITATSDTLRHRMEDTG